MTEHENKYDGIAREIGIDFLVPLLVERKDEIRQALENGDTHLNSIPIKWWNEKAGGRTLLNGNVTLIIDYPWTFYAGPQSLAMRVCVLKHVAKFYLEER